MIAIMVAFQAELIWRRARALTPASASRGPLHAQYRDRELVN